MKVKYIFLGIAVGTLLVGLGVTLPLVFGFGKTGKNTTVLGKDYSLLDKSQIKTKLAADFPFPETLVLQDESRQFQFSLASVSAQINSEVLASDLLFRRLNKGLINYFKAFFSPKDFSLEISYQSDKIDQALAPIIAQVDQPFVPSEVVLVSTPQIKTGQIGRKANFNALHQSIVFALQNYEIRAPISITVDSVGSLPDSTQTSQALAVAAKLVGKSLELVAPDQSVILDDKTLISWIGFGTSCRIDRIDEYLVGLNTSLKKDPVDAVFKIENSKVTDFRPSQNGYVLDTTNLNQQICSKIDELTNNKDKQIKHILSTIASEPKIKTANVNNLGIKDLLGRGVSTFKHSSEIRNFNVEKGASIVNRILVAPNETFSFLKNLGDVSLENGFKKAYVIKAGKTEMDVGGGICQVSTTFFRAMLNAGLDITQRQNHAYRVSYYEEDMPPGYDATVFIPAPDLKFINDTGNYLLIQSSYDGKLKKLVYEIYGTSDGRKVEITNYRQWDATPAPPDVYIDDPTLPAGKVVKDESRVPGLKTSFDWKVTKNGEVIHKKTFQSVYTPWAAVYRRGVQN